MLVLITSCCEAQYSDNPSNSFDKETDVTNQEAAVQSNCGNTSIMKHAFLCGELQFVLVFVLFHVSDQLVKRNPNQGINGQTPREKSTMGQKGGKR